MVAHSFLRLLMRLPIGSSPGQNWPRETIVDQRDRHRCVVVVLGEVAAAEKRDSHGREIIRCNQPEVRAAARLTRRRGAAFDVERKAPVARAQRQQVHGARGSDAGQVADALHQSAIERDLGRGRLVVALGGRDAHREHVLGREPWVHCLQSAEALEQQARPDYQHQRQRDLQRRERRATDGARATLRSSAALFERTGEIGIRQTQRGREAEDDAGGNRSRERCGQHTCINCDRAEARRIRGQHRNEPRLDPEGEQHSGDTARRCERDTLGEKLAHDASAGRTVGRTHGDLLDAAGRARQLQVRDVGTGDQEHQADGAQQH